MNSMSQPTGFDGWRRMIAIPATTYATPVIVNRPHRNHWLP